MLEIKNTETLQAEITRLKSTIIVKEQMIRDRISAIGETLKPSNLLSAGINRMMGESKEKTEKSFMKEAAKTGILLLIQKVFNKPGDKGDERLSDFVDMAFDKIIKMTERKNKQEKSFYKFEDDFDSESN